MPELPEVETSRLGIASAITGKRVLRITVRKRQLRWPIPRDLETALVGEKLTAVERRGKYLLLRCGGKTALLHLGMSGSVRLVSGATKPTKHDHVDLIFEDDVILRFNDPRRFGALLWTDADPFTHPLLNKLGPEPLSRAFNKTYLAKKLARKQQPIKQALMDAQLVVGIGNIYANEGLFLAGILPTRPSNQLTADECQQLVITLKKLLKRAIAKGGTTLKDFSSADGKPGYFKQKLQVYGREGEACLRCASPLAAERLGGRATVYCATCQR